MFYQHQSNNICCLPWMWPESAYGCHKFSEVALEEFEVRGYTSYVHTVFQSEYVQTPSLFHMPLCLNIIDPSNRPSAPS